MSAASHVIVNIDKAGLERLILDKMRAAEARFTVRVIAEKMGQGVVKEAKQIAEVELHRRPTERRTKESLRHGAEYHDSFFYRVNMAGYPRQILVECGNRHPAAPIIRKGSTPHQIPSTPGWIRFPAGKGSHVARGSKGTWAVNGPPWVSTTVAVEHPGQEAALEITLRAAHKYLGRK